MSVVRVADDSFSFLFVSNDCDCSDCGAWKKNRIETNASERPKNEEPMNEKNIPQKLNCKFGF